MTDPLGSAGFRDNYAKLPYHLVPPLAIEEMTKVLEFGAKKYAPRNWEKGLNWESGCLSSLLRHVAAWRKGEDLDPETGLSHMSHVLTNAAFLVHFIQTGTGTDDRVPYQKIIQKEQTQKAAAVAAEVLLDSEWIVATVANVEAYRDQLQSNTNHREYVRNGAVLKSLLVSKTGRLLKACYKAKPTAFIESETMVLEISRPEGKD